MVAVQCAMNATSITDLFLQQGIKNIRIGSPSLLLRKTVSSERYVRHMGTQLFIISQITRKLVPFFRKQMRTILGTVQSVSSRQNNK
jgi:hypothetical protein